MRKLAIVISGLFWASATTPAAASQPAADVCGVSPHTSPSPSTAAVERLVKDWVIAINSADDATYLRFLKERGPVPSNGFEPILMRDFLRGMLLCGVKSAQADAVEMWAFDPKMDSYGIWKFKPGTPESSKTQFVAASFTDELPPGVTPPAKLAIPAWIAAIDQRAADWAKKDDFSGAILVAQHGRVLFQKAYGLADRTNRKPNSLDTQFRFGSMGKMFTAVAVMQLVEQGRINLNAPVGRYLTTYPNQDIAKKVTIAHLLSHTGGTGDIFGPDFKRHKDTLRTAKDYIDLFGTRSPAFLPGSRQAYSNYGFILLGRIVEQVSGLGYDEYVQRHIFGPLGMASTGNRAETKNLPRRAVGYMGSGAGLKSAADTLPMNGTPAGGGYSTVGDFHRFMQGLTSNRLMRHETLQKLIDGGVKTADGEFAQFDFGDTVPGAGRWIGHSGGAPGMAGTLEHFLGSGVTLIILANRDPANAKGIATFAEHRLPAD
jgi:D-alanyl-D-alanine carboxypeptidase